MRQLTAHIECGEFKGTFVGEYNEVWRSLNELLGRIAKSGIINSSDHSRPVGALSVGDILVEMRNTGFFNTARSSNDAFIRVRELGRTNMTRNAVSMALKSLVGKGELTRQSKGKSYVYLSPFAEVKTAHE